MEKIHVTKTSFCKLLRDKCPEIDLPSLKEITFKKGWRNPMYWLEFSTIECEYKVVLYPWFGKMLLRIKKHIYDDYDESLDEQIIENTIRFEFGELPLFGMLREKESYVRKN